VVFGREDAMSQGSPAVGVRGTVFLTTDGRRRLRRRYMALASDLEAVSERMRNDGVTDEDRDVYARALQTMEEYARLLAVARDAADVHDRSGRVGPGDTVSIEHADGSRESFLLVHPIEVPLADDRVSIDSPLGRALLGRAPGDVVTVGAPGVSYRCTVVGTDGPGD
jgi:transcription elongation GreA/GreB family factor